MDNIISQQSAEANISQIFSASTRTVIYVRGAILLRIFVESKV